MNNVNYNKIIIDGEVKIDLTGDTVRPDKLAQGYTAHDKSGAIITGTSTFDADTSDGTIDPSEVLSGEIAYSHGQKIIGEMRNNESVSGSISSKDEQYTVPQGYHDGSGKVGIDEVEKAKLVASNIREGVTVLGVVGTMSDTEGTKAQQKTVTPSFETQTIVPTSPEYNVLSQVTVRPIPVSYSDNAQGGITVTVG